MPDGPTLLLDKSTFQGLSAKEHLQLQIRFRLTLVPVLYSELIADLTKSEGEVAQLAKKFLGSGETPNVHSRLLAAASLQGQKVPMTGEIVTDRGTMHRMPGGETAWFIDVQPENYDLMRWADDAFGPSDLAAAKAWRDGLGAVELPAFLGSSRTVGWRCRSRRPPIKSA